MAAAQPQPPSYTPDPPRLAASLPAIYAGHPDAAGLPAARRIAVIAADLADAGELDAADAGSAAAAVNFAALLHLAGPPGDPNRPANSAAIAAAWLYGAGAPEFFITAVSNAIRAAWDDADAWDSTDAAGPSGRLLRDAARLDLVSPQRHADYLRSLPAAYRSDCLLPALELRPRLALPAAAAMYDARLPRLAAWLDARDTPLIPADWRRLAEVSRIRRGVQRLLDGDDPAQVRAAMPAAGLPYAEYRARQRAVIAASHDRILELAHARIAASRKVAAEKYLESDTIHKPAVEENLFVSARRRARQLGLSPETAEDIARLLLSNARAVQERTLNDIAQRLSRLHGQILDAHSPETRATEADIAIPSLVVRTGDQPLARENELIKELRITGLNEAYPRQRRQFLRWFDPPHPYMATGQIVGSRDADLFLQALTGGQRCKVIATMPLEGPMHLGHGALVNLLAYFQSLGAEVVLGFRVPAQIANGTRREMRERLLTMAAGGLDLNRVDAYLQPARPAIVATAFTLGGAIPLSLLNSAFGLRLRDSATDTFRPLLRLADILHTQQPEYGGPCRTLVIDGIGGDVYVRMARNVAERFGFVKPSALYLRMLRSLVSYTDPRTGSAVEVMTNAVPRGRIAYADAADPAAVRRRIGRAYTGGRRTLAEQRQLGGNPDPRVCAVSGLHAFFATPEPAGYAELQRQCRAGALPCGQCKAQAADRVIEYLERQRQARNSLPAATAQHARRMAGPLAQED